MRPSWEQYFMGLAWIASRRSHDEQTQCGCVITDQENRILGMGYNDFPRNLDDTKLPTTRPDKYPWMIHAEKNALANCVIRPDNGIAYVTGKCCNDCLMYLWQEHVTTIYMATNLSSPKMVQNKESEKVFDKFLRLSQIDYYWMEANLDWMTTPDYNPMDIWGSKKRTHNKINKKEK